MGFLTALFQKRSNESEEGWGPLAGCGRKTHAGIYIDAETALAYACVFSAIRNISEDCAKLPLHEYDRKPDGGRVRTDSAIDYLINVAPNEEVTAFDFRQTLYAHAVGWGNGYAEVQWDRSDRPYALWNLEPDRVSPYRSKIDGKVYYKVKRPGSLTPDILPSWSILHVHGMGYNGLVGYNPLVIGKDSIALGLAAERFGASWFGNGAVPGVALQHPKKLSKEAKDRLRDSFDENYRGVDRAHGTIVLEEGLTLSNPITVSPEASQFLQTRQYQPKEIARLFRVPLSKIMDLEKSNYNSLEIQNLDYLTDSLLPWLIRLEKEVQRKLISNRSTRYVEHTTDALLRADTKTRYEAYAIARQWGWLNANDIRQRENLEVFEGGDIYLIPANMRDATEPPPEDNPPPGNPPSDPPENDPEEPQGDTNVRAMMEVFVDALKRLERIESGKQNLDLEKHRSYVRDCLSAPVKALCILFKRDQTLTLERIVEEHILTLRSGDTINTLDHARGMFRLATGV